MSGSKPPRDPSPLNALSLRALEACADAILVTTNDQALPGPTIVFANRAFCAMTGYARREILGRNPRMFQGPKTERAVLDRARDALFAGTDFSGEVWNYRKDGSEYLIEWRLAPVRESTGEITHWVAVQRDITEHRRFERELITHAQALHAELSAIGTEPDAAVTA